jgi:hypothetical protein
MNVICKDSHPPTRVDRRKTQAAGRGILNLSLRLRRDAQPYPCRFVKIDRESALKWSNDEVIARWMAIYKPSPIVIRHLDGLKQTKAEQKVVAEEIDKWRHRLCDVSWLMHNLNESNARQANEEDECSGKSGMGGLKSRPCWMMQPC